LDIINRWILSRFYSALKEATKSLEKYRFNEAINILYGFFWHEFCDWYLEIIKPDIRNQHNQVVMYKILEKSLRLLHPFIPFITEEIWQRLPHEPNSIVIASWPHFQEQIIDKKSENLAQGLFGIIKTIRNLRSELEITPEQKITVSIYPHTQAIKKLTLNNSSIIVNLSRLDKLNILDNHQRPESVISDISQDADIYLHFSGLVDISGEKSKIKDKLNLEAKRLEAKKKLILNPEFIKKAHAEVVESIKIEITELKNKTKRLERLYHELR
jgi:valyl-tRNA synthetase